MSPELGATPRDVFYLACCIAQMDGLRFAGETTKAFKKTVKKGVGRSAASSIEPRPNGMVYAGALSSLIGCMPVMPTIAEVLNAPPEAVGPAIVRTVVQRVWPEHAGDWEDAYLKAAGVIPQAGDDPGTTLRNGRAFVDAAWRGVPDAALPVAVAFLYQFMAGARAGAAELQRGSGFWFPTAP